MKVVVSIDSAAGREQCCEDALAGAGDEQFDTALRDAADAGGNREARHADDEGALAAPVVGDTSAEEQQRTERQGVRRDHPRAVKVADAQFLLGCR